MNSGGDQSICVFINSILGRHACVVVGGAVVWYVSASCALFATLLQKTRDRVRDTACQLSVTDRVSAWSAREFSRSLCALQFVQCVP